MSDKHGKIDTGLIRELAAILKEANLGEIEVEHAELRIRVSRPEPATISYQPAPAYAPAPATAPAPAAAAAPAISAAPAADHPGLVKSPMVGTAYLSPEPGAKAFVKVGDAVAEGATLMLVEAMKTFNPVTAPRAGVVKEIIVRDQKPVEYGEPLIVIE